LPNKRELAGIQLLQKKIRIIRKNESNYQVSSESDPTLKYEVNWHRNRWVCGCPDFEKRDKKCKHVYALEYFLMLNEISENLEDTNPLPDCPRCGLSLHVIKRGFRQKRSGPEQRYYCKNVTCRYRFVKQNSFNWMRTKAKIIASSLDLYFKGLSLRSISSHLQDSYGVKVSHATVHNWLKKYVKIVNRYVEKRPVETGERWLGDELIVTITGRHAVWWNLLDAESRFVIARQISSARDTENAQELIRKGLRVSTKNPTEFVSDGLKSYPSAIENEISNLTAGKNQTFVHLQGPLLMGLNNKIERYHGEARSRLKTMNHLRNEESVDTFAGGFTTQHNYIKQHKSLNGKTPAQFAKVEKEKCTWLSLIEKADDQIARDRKQVNENS
jgi:transposase-like protein